MPATTSMTLVSELISDDQIFALLQQLSAKLLANKSATAVLEKWCADNAIGDGEMIVARPLSGPYCAPSAQTRARLKIGADTEVRYRNVALMCGDTLLSVAQNWYVPERLTPAMNEVLTSSETPFGKVIAPLNPTRQTLSVTLQWEPCETGLDGAIPKNLLEHRAILSSEEGLPIAGVIETYQRGVLGLRHSTS